MDYLDFNFGVAEGLLVQLEEVRTENDREPISADFENKTNSPKKPANRNTCVDENVEALVARV